MTTTKQCTECGGDFTPIYLKTIHKWSRTCSTCALKHIAEWMEEVTPEDSIEDISRGEQIGAQIREMIRSKY